MELEAIIDICDELESKLGTVDNLTHNTMRRAKWEIERLRECSDAMARQLDVFEAQGSDKTEALRAYRAFRQVCRGNMPQTDIEKSIALSVKPGLLVKHTENYKSWCHITECPKCWRMAHYIDQHPANPCNNCGHKPVEVTVGRWVSEPPNWKSFWREKRGYWEILHRNQLKNLKREG